MNNSEKFVYFFSRDNVDGNRSMKALLGGKGANLAEMSSLKLPVPPGFTITTKACVNYQKINSITPALREEVLSHLKKLEEVTNKTFGGLARPLLLSVRSGASVSMPGMMDTILNLGLNEKSVAALAKETQNPRFAWDSYRRFIQMYSNVVMDLNHSLFDVTLEDYKEERGYQKDTDLTETDWKLIVSSFKQIILEECGKLFPEDPYEQLWAAIEAVFKSWNNNRAIKYRELNNISHDLGTAVNVQSMVFGNTGDNSATGVCFTRNPSNGTKEFFGEFLINAQGEDVVAGIRTPAPINEASKNTVNKNELTLEKVLPECYTQLVNLYQQLEKHYRDMQDIEFTIENNKLFILQTRSGKRTVAAALKIAVDLVNEGVITKEEAIMRISPENLNQLLHPTLDPNAKKQKLGLGLPASPGAASGRIAFSPEEVQSFHEKKIESILVRNETSPEDIVGMSQSEGILTARGGMTSHAAVVARGMGKPCVAGCSALIVDENKKRVIINGKELTSNDSITIDGATGEIFDGIVPRVKPALSGDFGKFMSWANEAKRMKVRANADNFEDSTQARSFNAEGIGLCRTEHMFFGLERILCIREMIFAKTEETRKRALEKLLPFQRQDFTAIFKAMDGYPVNIRLLDPPLHEFLPHADKEKKELAERLHISMKEVDSRIEILKEFNPMLGHRGCRLGITYPEIYKMQVRAIVEAACDVHKNGVRVVPEIMIPLVGLEEELIIMRKLVEEESRVVMNEKKVEIKIKIGTMIEVPRAAILANKVANHADFFSYGTNDLTQMTLGISRDDAGKFLNEYVAKNIIPRDPFVSIDEYGVGHLIRHSIETTSNMENKKLHYGICGEHGGDPMSIDFCERVGLDYVSCSPYRVPIAILSAAQATIRNKQK